MSPFISTVNSCKTSISKFLDELSNEFFPDQFEIPDSEAPPQQSEKIPPILLHKTHLQINSNLHTIGLQLENIYAKLLDYNPFESLLSIMEAMGPPLMQPQAIVQHKQEQEQQQTHPSKIKIIVSKLLNVKRKPQE